MKIEIIFHKADFKKKQLTENVPEFKRYCATGKKLPYMIGDVQCRYMLC